MNKRITYLLATLLLAQSLSPVYAQSLNMQDSNLSLRQSNSLITSGSAVKPNTNRPTTSGSAVKPNTNKPTTSGPAISTTTTNVKVTVTANSVTTSSGLKVSTFLNPYVSVAVKLIDTEIASPKDYASSLASYISGSLNINSADSKEDWERVSSVAIYNPSEFTIDIKTDNIDITTLKDVLSFTIPSSLLTTDQDVTVSIPLTYDLTLPGEANVTTGPILASNIAGGNVTIGVSLVNTVFKEPKHAAGSVHSYILSSLNLKTLDNKKIEGPTELRVNNESEFVFSMKATNIDASSIPDTLIFTISGNLFTHGKDLIVRVPVIHDTLAAPKVSLTSGTYSSTQYVTLSGASGLTIRYTTDGSQVTLNSPVYTANLPIEISKSTVLKVAAFKGTMPSKTVTMNYIISTKSNVSSGGTSGGASAGASQVVTPPTLNTTLSNSLNEVVSQANILAPSKTVEKLIQSTKRQLSSPSTKVTYGLTVNNKKVPLENSLLASNGRTLVPVRTLSEALNLPIQYDSASKTTIIQSGNTIIELPLGYNVAIVNGQTVQIDKENPNVMSTLENNRTYLPIRFIAEQLNLSVDFNNSQVKITSNK